MAPYMTHTASELSSPVDSIQSPRGMPSDPIAVIGMSCKFSGEATTPEKLWQLVVKGQDGWSPIPKSRFNSDAFYDQDHAKVGMSNVVGAHFIQDDVSKFDASFFNFTSEIANAMDPQIRMLLESVFEASENAGMPLQKLAGSDTSVFMGSFSRDYHDSLMRDPDTLPRTALTGNGVAMMSNRVSHFFDLRGPSLTTDTGCSASLAALHLAVQSIRNGESRMSIVGASNLLLNPDPFIVMSGLGVLGADGRCFAWDSRANGYGRGEGIATLLLKPLGDAVRDGDPIHAVIRETAINQDGKTPTITSPSSKAQEELIRACYQRAGLDPIHTPYVEAHMTGTPTGDPIEANAISRVFSKGRSADNPILVGSVKTNLGHLEASSGIAGVIKGIMMLKNGVIPPSLNYETANPNIDMQQLKVRVPLVAQNWPEGMPRRISVNNYGYGGTNGHVIIDGPTEHVQEVVNASQVITTPRLFVFSSKDTTATSQMVDNLKTYLESRKALGINVDCDDLAYTLEARRTHFPWRFAISSMNCQQDLADGLRDSVGKAVTLAKDPPRVGFVFNGQGAQWHAMGRELIALYPTFQKSLLRADAVLSDYGADWSLVQELRRDEESTRVNEPRLSQPVCVALQICLVDLLKSWGIQPSAVTSHSSGEISAAYAAGALTFKEALGVAYFRGTLTEKYLAALPRAGGMLAVGLGADDTWSYLAEHAISKDTVTVACINSPSSVTLSGDLDAIERLEKNLIQDQIFARKLKVKSAYHSHHMLPMAEEYYRTLKSIIQPKLKWEKVIYASPVTGNLIDSPQKLGPQHWVNNLLWPVLFSQSFEAMCAPASNDSQPQVDFILEIGPHSALAGPIRQVFKIPALKDLNLGYASCLVRSQNAVISMQNAAGSLWCKGYPVDLSAINCLEKGKHRRVISDIPSYPWNHNNSFWQESRLNVVHRQRKHVRHELIGSMLHGPASKNPTWRHFLKPSELTWLRHHLVQSDMVYPGAGGIIMAIEALRQFSGLGPEAIEGYCLKEIDIINALVIPDSEAGIEVQLSLHSCDRKALEPGWYEFSLKSPGVDQESWTEHIRGYISQKRKLDVPFSTVQPTDSSVQQVGYSHSIETDDLFERLRNLGLEHGPAFQNMLNIWTTCSGSKFDFQVADVGSASHHILHPTTLDSIFQGAYAALPSDVYQNSMVMPRSIDEIFVSQSISSFPGSRFEAFATVNQQDRSGFRSTITTRDPNCPESVNLLVKGLFCQAVGGIRRDQTAADAPKLLFKMLWHPDMTLMPVETMKNTLKFDADAQELSINKKLIRAAWYFIQDAIQDINSDQEALSQMEWYHKLLLNWMQTRYEEGLSGTLARGSGSWQKASKGMKHMLFDEVSSQSVNGRLLCRVGRNLSKILRKEASPLEVMMENNLLYDFYEKALRCNRSYAQVQKLVHLFSMKTPRANVLEIGGGTGGCTGSVLKGLAEDTPDGKYRFSSYTFTDVSPGFFESAAKKFEKYGNMINFKKLDIEVDPEQQSFTPGSYDLIIACQVLHATKNMEKTMRNVRKLLKPGGKLILVETTKDTLDVQLIFGTLPGWWLAEEPERKGGPNLTLDHWGRVLKSTGFTGIEADIHDLEEDENYSFSVMTSTAAASVSYPSQVFILCPPEVPMIWRNSLTDAISSRTGIATTFADWRNIEATDKVCIMLAEIVEPLLSRLTEEEFKSLQHLLTTARGVLWVTRAGLTRGVNPDMAMHSGLLRTLRMEDAGRRYISLDLDTVDSPWASKNAEFISDVVKVSFDLSRSSKDIDCEYAVQDSLLHISRIYSDDVENKLLARDYIENEPEVRKFGSQTSTSILQMEVGTPGLLDTLQFREISREEASISADHIEIEPHAFGLNFRDVLVALGQLDETIMGYECSGVVTRLGPEAQKHSGFKVGDRVCAILRGHWATRVLINWSCAVRIPDSMSFEEAATIPMVFATAHHGLFDIGRLAKDETVLIHAATGGVGQAAVMLAQNRGANVFVTVGSQAKRDFVIKEFGIPESNIFSSRDVSFGPALMAATGGKGVDVVLNSLSGPLLQETWNCMARFGRFVEIGKRDMEAGKNMEMSPLRRAVTFSAVDLFQLGKYRGPVVHNVLLDVMDMFSRGCIRTVAPITKYSISDVGKAFRLMQSGKHLGKIVVTPHKSDLVKIIQAPKAAFLYPEASYLIVGGMGGIGQSIARHMARNLGCKNLVILSRHALSHPDSASLRFDLEAAGCKAVIQNCDVSDEEEFRQLLSQVQQELPPIRGVIQAAMTLNDSIFPNMKYHQWLAATGPKISATWNIHRNLAELDFFIMLSSLTGLGGNTSQANYSAGGTFQDAFAKYRTSLSLPAVAIDLASIQGVGFVANTAGVSERLTKTGLADIGEDQMLQIIETAIQRPLRPVDLSQLITGILEFDESSSVAWVNDTRFTSARVTHYTSGDKDSRTNQQGVTTARLSDSLQRATSGESAITLIQGAIISKLAEMFGLDASEIDKKYPVSKYGVDSLIAVELRNWLVSSAGAETTSIFDVLHSPSLSILAEKIGEKSRYVSMLVKPT
ncbi:polyketide synthase [Colletotrichum truncatum]|uniref:Polyketide synthase n=1 Tax=Colletotrichum truncatum TaxID=5467 RepID=A0ACC3YNB9_COLTU|nr:polyketide synthase [Colletotrichum truncatum]KAF6789509.1 polyketide synthase [Colletotrichum truncatum]